MDKIYLQSSDGEVIEADRDIIKLSSMLNLFQGTIVRSKAINSRLYDGRLAR